MTDISPLIKEKAPLILDVIKSVNTVLLHCHPSPDPDSVGSALAMKYALEQLGKRVSLIQGDSEIPQAFMQFPGAETIEKKNFFDLDLAQFDLFIILDSGSPEMISRWKPVEFPANLKTVIIDHHISNKGYAQLNLVESSYPATSQVLFDLFTIWQIEITLEIALNLFVGIFTDTGGFKYEGTSSRTFEVAAALAKISPQFPKLIGDMENSDTPGMISFQGLALSSIETECGGKLALSIVSKEDLVRQNIPIADARTSLISSTMRTVANWPIVGALIETEENKIRASFRTHDDMYDLSKLASALGGGGHKAASGAVLSMSLEEARKLVVAKVKELYNL